ncbi:hypothetical protein EDB84DRAFT_1044597 [Lactarius hengduanensis]|nr:hypothetical protein EDB84DRAFT_1044597 [Lactarius hengduanensis]
MVRVFHPETEHGDEVCVVVFWRAQRRSGLRRVEPHSSRAVLLIQPKGSTDRVLGPTAKPTYPTMHASSFPGPDQLCARRQIVSSGNQLFFVSYGKDSDDSTAPAQWSPMDRSPLTASSAMFNHTGDSVILTHMSEHAIRIVDVPSLALRENLAAHVGGCVAAALDPRGRYLASGGFDSIVNLDRESVRHQRVDCCSYDHRLRDLMRYFLCTMKWRLSVTGSWPRIGGRMQTASCSSVVYSQPLSRDFCHSHLSSQTSSQDVSAFYLSQPIPGGQFEQFRHTSTSTSQSNLRTHRGAHVMVCKLGSEPRYCRVRDLDPRMGAPILGHDSVTVQSTQKCACSSVHMAAGIAGGSSKSCTPSCISPSSSSSGSLC